MYARRTLEGIQARRRQRDDRASGPAAAEAATVRGCPQRVVGRTPPSDGRRSAPPLIQQPLAFSPTLLSEVSMYLHVGVCVCVCARSSS